MRLSVIEIVQAVGGKLISGDEKFVVNGVSTDTRTLVPGNLYVALKGPRFDGHDFLEEAKRKGAVGALVSEVGARHSAAAAEAAASAKEAAVPLQESFPLIQVPDTLKALGDLAHFWRKKFSIPVIAITGSSGKTSTKELIAACLETQRSVTQGAVLKTEGNLNNLIGLPLTLLKLSPAHRYAIVEMGMNALGEIARLTEIAEPTVGLITNVGKAHLEGVGGIKGVAKAKEELFRNLKTSATAFVNADDPYIIRMKTKAKIITFSLKQAAGLKEPADVFCREVRYGENQMKMTVGETTFILPIVGEHHALNWLACYAVVSHFGISPSQAEEALQKIKPAKMRGEILNLKNGIVMINDAYNANPDSMKAALTAASLRYPRQRKIAVLGEMLELGGKTSSLHWEVGRDAAKNGFEILLAFGNHGEEMKKGFLSVQKKGMGDVFSDMDSLNRKLSSLLLPQDVVLVKGSRGSQMERVVDYVLSLSLSAS